jgi:hypothetical protein
MIDMLLEPSTIPVLSTPRGACYFLGKHLQSLKHIERLGEQQNGLSSPSRRFAGNEAVMLQSPSALLLLCGGLHLNMPEGSSWPAWTSKRPSMSIETKSCG